MRVLGRLGEAAKDKDCTCFSWSRLDKVSELRETESWGWEGKGPERSASCGERWAGFGMQDAGRGSQDSIIPAAHKGPGEGRDSGLHLDDLASWDSRFLLFLHLLAC